MHLLIAEDDPQLGPFLCRALRGEVEEIELAAAGDIALDAFQRSRPDLLLLDLDLPGRSGAEVLEAARALAPLCSILVLSGRAEAPVRTECLRMGADDCMQKPFSLGELRARCASLLRRQRAIATQAMRQRENAEEPSEDEKAYAEAEVDLVAHEVTGERRLTLSLGGLRVHRARRVVEVLGTSLHLTNREFALLEQLLLAAPGNPVSRATLCAAIWTGKEGSDSRNGARVTQSAYTSNFVEVHLAALRRKLQLFPEAPVLRTIRGIGYQLAPADPNAACGGKVSCSGEFADKYLAELAAIGPAARNHPCGLPAGRGMLSPAAVNEANTNGGAHARVC